MRNLLVWVVVQDERGRALLGRRDGSAYGHGLWGLPEAAAREVSGDVGLSLDPPSLRVLGVHLNRGVFLTESDVRQARGIA
ncbi:hypothetical protein [Deinococcus sp.]|uniref:hypothetical protein n=1 Tax=Deinococcus sp. TaxID=47478 RepID=UPI0025C3F7DB|nr:hypothetical protein [Deinococcus sp.]